MPTLFANGRRNHTLGNVRDQTLTDDESHSWRGTRWVTLIIRLLAKSLTKIGHPIILNRKIKFPEKLFRKKKIWLISTQAMFAWWICLSNALSSCLPRHLCEHRRSYRRWLMELMYYNEGNIKKIFTHVYIEFIYEKHTFQSRKSIRVCESRWSAFE